MERARPGDGGKGGVAGGAPRRHLRVACAIIEQDGLVLVAQRSSTMSLPLKWEFPGGKIRDGELPAGCLQRELREELGIAAAVREALPPSTHHYADFSVTLHPFRCAEPSGPITLHEHAAIIWLAPEELGRLDWAEADLPVIAEYLARRRAGGAAAHS
ncbi:MAG TPA: (deoxy)nucleoside triphosphate pyrophosphohydrolase [Candidatus Methanoperedens sp.]|nr:(deoxy)nucleoside triphosphate pyrophosphohydrolase [Candidatus Methanoperedens sp.]